MAEVSPGVVWLVSAILVEAAVIDGRQLRVPNWLTFHFVLGGLAYACYVGGREAFLWSLAGTGVGLVSLLPLYAIGGMGAGDVKLMAGVGAWMGPSLTLGAFAASALVGGLFGLAMILASGDLIRHWAMFQTIGHEILSIRNPTRLAELAGERKKSMTLLPYGIPIAVGSISYFGWMGLFF
ncbi:MAG TPA: A24 family peptidase [Isosphaeraceae bacterium]|jgi:prepilin peptidase CpaA|nr:A24 family peptidase [Isosphaeraceae bacterium]